MKEQQPLIVRYRPTTLSEVVGHDETMRVLARVMASESPPHTYLLTGIHGCGKTSIARIIASTLEADVLEIDAASHSKVEETRDVVEVGFHMALSGTGRRLILIDECFAPFTKITTPNGYKHISQIHIGDLVLSAVGPSKVTQTFTTWVPVHRMLQLNYEKGGTMLCSADHEILSTTGWVPATMLRKGDSVHAGRVSNKMLRVWDSIRGRMEPHTVRRLPHSLLHNLSDSVSVVQSPQTPALFKAVWECISRYSPFRYPSGLGWTTGIGGTYPLPYTESRIICPTGYKFVASNATTKPNVRCDQHRENENYQTAQWNVLCMGRPTWWKWPAYPRTVSFTRAYQYVVRVSSNYWDATIRMAACLQTRSSITTPETRNRSRRKRASYQESKTTGRAERSKASAAWMDRVTSIKRGRDAIVGQDLELNYINGELHAKFYDLEVAEHPSYIAEGVIVHNCHRLSRQAMDALLKITEEPPSHLYFALCTTEYKKLPETLLSRCFHVKLNPLSRTDMEAFMWTIADLEGWTVLPDIMVMVIEAAEGSPRQAMTLLQVVHDAESREQVRRIIPLQDASNPLIALARLGIDGRASWAQAKRLLGQMTDEGYDFDEAFALLGRYLCSAMLRSDNEQSARHIHSLLELAAYPSNSFDRKVLLYVLVGRLIWGDKA